MSNWDPCPWCGLDVEMEEIDLGDDEIIYFFCPNKTDCGWTDMHGRDTTKEEWERLGEP